MILTRLVQDHADFLYDSIVRNLQEMSEICIGLSYKCGKKAEKKRGSISDEIDSSRNLMLCQKL
jgi:hypothetical protein